MTVSDEHMQLLKRQADLIQRLKAVIASQQQALEQLGVADAREGDEARVAEGYDSGAEADQKRLNAIGQGTRREAEAPITDEERKAGNVEYSEPTEEEERNFMATKPWLGAMAPPSDWSWEASQARDAAPEGRLDLEYVHGYCARGQRQNIAHIGNGRIVYPVAAVAVVHTVDNRTQQYFREHDDDIMCLDFHMNSRLCATGQRGRDAPFYVWNVDKPSEVVAKFVCHKRAVVSVGFSVDGTKVASVGLDDEHSVAVSSITTKQTLCVVDGDKNPIYHVQFNRTNGADGNNEFVSVGNKNIKFWTLGGGSLTSKKGLLGRQGEYQSFMSVSFTPEHTIVACESGQVYAFEQNKLANVLAAHNGATYAMDFCSQSNLVTGGRDGFVNVWDKSSLKNIATIDLNKADPCKGLNSVRAIFVNNSNPSVALVGTLASSIYEVNLKTGAVKNIVTGHYGELEKASGEGELWALATHPSSRYFATAGQDQTLRVWSIDQRQQVARTDIGNSAVCAAFSPDGKYIAVGCESGAFVVVAFASGGSPSLTETLSIKRHNRRVQSIRYSPDGKYLAIGCADNTAEVYSVSGDEYKPVGKCNGNSSVILHVDFSSDSKYLQTCSQAYELLFYELPSCSQVTKSRSLNNTEWATFTSKLGWSVQGIWPKEADGSDINMVGRSHSGALLATAEDSGLVKVFNYPCVGSGLDKTGKLSRRPDSIRGVGHSEHVTSVEWCNDDSRLISTGGADLSIFQWKYVKA